MFTKSELYDEKILPLIRQLEILCAQNKVPIFISCVVEDSEEAGTVYKNTMVSAAQASVTLQDDKLIEMVKVLNGFTTVPNEEPLEMEFDFDNE